MYNIKIIGLKFTCTRKVFRLQFHQKVTHCKVKHQQLFCFAFPRATRKRTGEELCLILTSFNFGLGCVLILFSINPGCFRLGVVLLVAEGQRSPLPGPEPLSALLR